MHHAPAQYFAILVVMFAPLLAGCGAEHARQAAAAQEYFVEHHEPSGGESVAQPTVATRSLPPTIYVFAGYGTPGAPPLGPIYAQSPFAGDLLGVQFPRARRARGHGWIAGVAVGTVLGVVVIGLIAAVAAASSAVNAASSASYNSGFPIGAP